MDQGKYSLAREYADSDQVALDTICCKEADDLFAAGKLEASAALYAETRRPFEEVALKFMNEDRRKALRVYLRNKLDGLNAMEKPQRVMLVTWLLELELNALGEVRDKVGESGGPKDEEELATAKNRVRNLLGLPHVKVRFVISSQLLSSLACILHLSFGSYHLQSAVSDCKNVIYDLLSSHGDLDNLVFFAGQMRDFSKVLQHHISRGNYSSGNAVEL